MGGPATTSYSCLQPRFSFFYLDSFLCVLELGSSICILISVLSGICIITVGVVGETKAGRQERQRAGRGVRPDDNAHLAICPEFMTPVHLRLFIAAGKSLCLDKSVLLYKEKAGRKVHRFVVVVLGRAVSAQPSTRRTRPPRAAKGMTVRCTQRLRCTLFTCMIAYWCTCLVLAPAAACSRRQGESPLLSRQTRGQGVRQ